MNTIADLVARLRPGVSIRAVACTIGGRATKLHESIAAARKVVTVDAAAIRLDNGKFIPLGCLATFVLDGTVDHFNVHVGAMSVTYEIADGNA